MTQFSSHDPNEVDALIAIFESVYAHHLPEKRVIIREGVDVEALRQKPQFRYLLESGWRFEVYQTWEKRLARQLNRPYYPPGKEFEHGQVVAVSKQLKIVGRGSKERIVEIDFAGVYDALFLGYRTLFNYQTAKYRRAALVSIGLLPDPILAPLDNIVDEESPEYQAFLERLVADAEREPAIPGRKALFKMLSEP